MDHKNQAVKSYVAYLRDSGGETQELSTDQQLAEIQRYALAHSLAITKTYRDDARPGSSTVDRDGFLAMIDYLRHDASVTGLIIWRWSRFSRDINDAQFYRADMRRRGYRIISISDNLPEGPESILFEAALDWSNQRFLDDLSRDVKRGLRNLVLSYGCVPGTPPRGFIRQPVEIGKRRDGRPHLGHRWVPDPDLIPTIQKAFTMRAAGQTLRQISNETGLFSSANSYKTFFANPLYIGQLRFADLVIDDYCQPLIDQPTWIAVQKQIAIHAQRQHLTGDNPDHPRRAHSPYLLTGLLHCDRCGSPHYATRARNHIKYVCTRAHRRHDCDAPSIPAKPLEIAVINALDQILSDPAHLAIIEQRLQTEKQDRQAVLNREHDELAARLAVIRRTITRLTRTIETADDYQPRAILKRLQELETNETDLQIKLSDIENQLNTPIPTHTGIELDQLAAMLHQNLTHETDTQKKRAILRAYIKSITVDRTGPLITGVITAFYPPGHDPPNTLKCEYISRAPLGAPPHRLTFSVPFSTQTKRPGV